jgi:hypothetical protein
MVRSFCSVLAFLVLLSIAAGIPALSRKYELPCASCHVHGAKLTSFGEYFRRKGLPMSGSNAGAGLPVSLWLSAVQSLPSSALGGDDPFLSRLELVSFGEVGSGVRVFLEWFPFSRTVRNGGLVDRSGRFENLWASLPFAEGWSFQIGQFRPLAAIDPNLRVAVSEPFGLGSALPGRPGGSERQTSLRAFSPILRSPAARISRTQGGEAVGGDSLQLIGTVLFPGELALPLSDAARRHTGPEWESRAKGWMAEALWHTVTGKVSGFHFRGDADRRATGIAGSLDLAPWHGEAAIWHGSGAFGGEGWRGSIEALFVPEWKRAFGLRFDAAEGERIWLVPFLSLHRGGEGDVWRLAAEARLRPGSTPVFVIELHYLR